MELSAAGQTDTGQQRQNNEDVFHVDLAEGLFLVSDGMGGAKAGEVASATAAETFARHVTQETELLTRARRDEAELMNVVALSKRAIEAACLDVFRLANSTQSRDGMGCTLTTMLVVGSRAVIGHVGDSRLYLIRSGRVEQLTFDHALAAELVRSGSLTPEQAQNSPYRNVLSRGVGLQSSVEVDTLIVNLQPGDRFVLCSDGFSEYLPDPNWLLDRLDGPLDTVCASLIDHANESGGHDNITVVVVEVAGMSPKEIMVELDGELLRVGALEESFLFKDFGFAELTRVLAQCTVRDLQKDEMLVNEGDKLDRIDLVMEGHLRAHGRGTLDLGPGDALGTTSILRPRQAVGSVIALAPSRVVSLSRAGLVNLTQRRGRIGAKLFQCIARELAANTERAHEALRRSEATPTVVAEII